MAKISVIIVSYNMAREIPRTVHSFLPPYQKGLAPEDVEVIVLENGSTRPVDAKIKSRWPAQVHYKVVENPMPSPARALNQGVALASADIVCPVIDGARMSSPGLLSGALKAMTGRNNAFVATIGFHLGHKTQQEAVEDGYDQNHEDKLLDSISWPEDGYRLFEIAARAGSSRGAWFGSLPESNAPVMQKSVYMKLGGYDEAFDIPGGGFVNLDFLSRASEMNDVDYMLLLGEATFHQYHDGVTTSRKVSIPEADGETTWQKYVNQYRLIRKKSYTFPKRKPLLFGEFPLCTAKIAQEGLNHILSI